MDPTNSYSPSKIRIQTLLLRNGCWSDMKYLQYSVVLYWFGRLCAVIPLKHCNTASPTWSSRRTNWWHKAGELMQNPKEDKSASKEEPLWMIAADFVARRDVWVGIHEDASTYGNEREHQKSSTDSESSFNQEGVRAASEATIMWEVPGLTQEVWSVHLARLITNINHSVVCSALRSCSCWRLLIFRGEKENAANIFTTSFTAQHQSDLKAKQNFPWQNCRLYVSGVVLRWSPSCAQMYYAKTFPLLSFRNETNNWRRHA